MADIRGVEHVRCEATDGDHDTSSGDLVEER
jgi:hypothetical protein